MINAFKTLWKSFVYIYDDILTLVLYNVFWFFLSLPIITIPPAFAGLNYGVNQLTHREQADWKTFFTGFKEFFWLSYKWALLNVAVFVILFSNIYFYGQMKEAWAFPVQTLFLSLTVIWIIIQMYVFPLLLEQQDRRLRTALRNSLVLIARKPWITIVLILMTAILVALSVYFTILFSILSVSLIVYLQNYFTIFIIDELVPAPTPPPSNEV
jgi:uncharacterized membrane protein YesL